MKIGDIVKKIPSGEEPMVTFCKEGGEPLYKVTYVKSNGSHRLYKCLKNGYKYLKSRANDPYFDEVM